MKPSPCRPSSFARLQTFKGRWSRGLGLTCLACAVMLSGMPTHVWSAPPAKTKRTASRNDGLQRFGDLLFGRTQQTRYATERRTSDSRVILSSTAVSVSPVAASALTVEPMTSSQPVLRPQQQVLLQPQAPVVQTASTPSGRSALSIPVTPGARVSSLAATTANNSASLSIEMSEPEVRKAVLVEAAPAATIARGPAWSAPVPNYPGYGVPSKQRGYVLPPGQTEEAGYLIDVRNMMPGEKVRDPRTGVVFLVPPF